MVFNYWKKGRINNNKIKLQIVPLINWILLRFNIIFFIIFPFLNIFITQVVKIEIKTNISVSPKQNYLKKNLIK